MKKNIWIWALAATTLMTACSQDNEPMPETTPPVTDNDFEAPDGQLIIQLGGYDDASANAVVTRSPILDNGSNFFYDLNQTITGTLNTLGIFALTDTPTEWSATADIPFEDQGVLLNNVQAIATTTKIGVDDGADVTGANLVNKISLKKSSATGTGSGDFGGVYYYPMLSHKNYTFYGYAPFQEGQTVSSEKTTVVFNNLKGSEDIMFCKASAATIGVDNIYINSAKATNKDVLEGYNAKYIRQLKYHKELNTPTDKENYSWIPNLKFKHEMVWLKFSVIAAKEQSKQDKYNAKENLAVSDIKLLEQPQSVSINIVEYGKTPQGTYLTATGTQSLSMLNVTSTGTAPDFDYTYTDDTASGTYAPEYNDTGEESAWTDVDSPKIIGYLLVPPTTTSYKLQLTVTPAKKDGVTPDKQTFTIDVKNGATGFEKGKSYNIRLGIYALQEVEATAELTPWGEDEVVDIPVE